MDMSGEEKGFVIKDRRTFDERGEAKADAVPKSPPGGEEKAAKTDGSDKGQRRPPLPEVNFSTFIFSLSSTALYHLGEIADPKTGERRQDLPLAKHSIDTLGMLREKTKGNLTKDEENLLDSILTELRLRYVKLNK
jgi:hypothetical protein